MWWRRGGGVARAWLRAWGREQCRDTRRGWLWAATGGSLLLGCAQAAHHTPAACLREGGVFLDPEDAQLTETCPLEMNEAAALTHTSLLRQASGVAVDAGVQLIHRTLRATLDFSQLHRKQLQEVLDMLEYCTTMLRHTEEHDRIWQLLVEARARQQSLKQQLQASAAAILTLT
ncbi:hypothetical protein GWK47_003795 [Chionoecetes opilio]|uniref:Uncharacterized protein n=1 Tax=Chionoecetes opilio TaxID=41210 RepID=A0A8J4YVP6_CHIOP|nr:hypothetical protein GWK47_003795 [Chionoecetes opilio]